MPNNPNEIREATYQAEKILLGSILIESQDLHALSEVRRLLIPSDFSHYIHRNIYEAMLSCVEPPNIVTVSKQMALLGTLESGVCGLLVDCIQLCPCCLDYPHYAKAVKDFSIQRSGNAKRPIIGRGGVDV